MPETITFPSTAQLVILGAGRPVSGPAPSALQQLDTHTRVLDWTLERFSNRASKIQFIGGYGIDTIQGSYPFLRFKSNSNWSATGSCGSLFCAELSPATTYVSYSDIVFDEHLIAEMEKSDPNQIIVAIDYSFPKKYRASTSLQGAIEREKVLLDGLSLMHAGIDIPPTESAAEFIGLIRLPTEAIAHLQQLSEKERKTLGRHHLSALINHLSSAGFPLSFIDATGHWSDLNDPTFLAQFVFGTKAETLGRLSHLLTTATIVPQERFTVGEWQTIPTTILQRITASFKETSLIVRSSSLQEDGFDSAAAGKFCSVLQVAPDSHSLSEAIQKVVASYKDGSPDNQILVQPMVKNVALSGVVFTRSPDSAAPYYCINYLKGSDTEGVTNGSSSNHQTLIVSRNHLDTLKECPEEITALLKMVSEVEYLTAYDRLDIEFAISDSGELFLLQVRPLVIKTEEDPKADTKVKNLISTAEQWWIASSEATHLLGSRPAYGAMPDWNPAEIIGARPGNLAFSLYHHLITGQQWAKQRAEMGYRDVRPSPLVKLIGGHAYVDIRASFNSFIPASLPNSIAEKVIDFCLEKLRNSPEFHDKVEFAIIPTCLTFDFETKQKEMMADGKFSHEEMLSFWNALRELTNGAIARCEQDFSKIAIAEKSFDKLNSLSLSGLPKALALLDDCQQTGTLPFAHMARHAFIAISLLRSAVAVGALEEERFQLFTRSIKTVSHSLESEVQKLKAGTRTQEQFLNTYGHLRPGTYDITIPNYAEAPESYLSPLLSEKGSKSEQESQNPTFTWSSNEKNRITALIEKSGFHFTFDQFDRFCQTSIMGREWAKFIFTRHLSSALTELATWGAGQQLNRSDLSQITLGDLQRAALGQTHGKDAGTFLKSRATEGSAAAHTTNLCKLPPLLFESRELSCFFLPCTLPNYVTTNRVRGILLKVDTDHLLEKSVKGKIVLIERADPGYDWLFGCDIIGLITQYGGANSHMAIRANEHNIPAAIGVGQKMYQKLRLASEIDLDCTKKTITIVS